MGLQLSRGSIDDQIELGDLLDERDLIFAGEQIGLELLELLLRRLMRLISFANDAAGPSSGSEYRGINLLFSISNYVAKFTIAKCALV